MDSCSVSGRRYSSEAANISEHMVLNCLRMASLALSLDMSCVFRTGLLPEFGGWGNVLLCFGR